MNHTVRKFHALLADHLAHLRGQLVVHGPQVENYCFKPLLFLVLVILVAFSVVSVCSINRIAFVSYCSLTLTPSNSQFFLIAISNTTLWMYHLFMSRIIMAPHNAQWGRQDHACQLICNEDIL